MRSSWAGRAGSGGWAGKCIWMERAHTSGQVALSHLGRLSRERAAPWPHVPPGTPQGASPLAFPPPVNQSTQTCQVTAQTLSHCLLPAGIFWALASHGEPISKDHERALGFPLASGHAQEAVTIGGSVQSFDPEDPQPSSPRALLLPVICCISLFFFRVRSPRAGWDGGALAGRVCGQDWNNGCRRRGFRSAGGGLLGIAQQVRGEVACAGMGCGQRSCHCLLAVNHIPVGCSVVSAKPPSCREASQGRDGDPSTPGDGAPGRSFG